MKSVVRLFLVLVFAFFFGSFFAQPASASDIILSGKVTDGSSLALSDVDVEAENTSSGEIVATDLTDDNGDYTLTLPVGYYNINVIPTANSGFREIKVTNLQVDEDTILNVVLVSVDAPLNFSGVLRDQDGVPITGVGLSLRNPSTSSYAQTGSDGSFLLEAAPGTYDLYVTKSGCNLSSPLPYCMSDLIVPGIVLDSDRVQDLTLPTVVLSITILDSDGQPIPNTFIQTNSINLSSFELFPGGPVSAGSIIGRAFTDGSGVASMILLPSSFLTLNIQPPSGSGAIPQYGVSVPSVLTDTSVTFVLRDSYNFSGVLRDQDGVPITGVGLSLRNPSTSSYAQTGSDGSFLLEAAPGTYDLYVTKSGCNLSSPLPYCMSDLIVPGIVLDSDRVQDLTLPTVVLSITILDSDGQPIPNTFIQTNSINLSSFELFPGGPVSAGSIIGRAFTDGSGVASMILLPSSFLTLNIQPPSGSGAIPQYGVSVPSVLTDTSVTFVLRDSYNFSGVLRDQDGVPITGVGLSLRNPSTSSYAQTGSDGSFLLEAAPGTYDLYVTKSGCNLSSPLPYCMSDLIVPGIVLDSDRVQDLTLPTVVLSITILDSDGQPIPNTFIQTNSINLSSFELFPGGPVSAGSIIGRAFTDGSGVASMILLPSSFLTLNIQPPSGSGAIPQYGVEVSDLIVDSSLVVSLQQINQSPTVDAGGMYQVEEGDSVVVMAVGVDPESGPMSYAWDLDNNGSYETSGQNVTFVASLLDGPSNHTIAVQVTDDGGITATDSATVGVLNVAPVVGTITAPIDPVLINTVVNTSSSFSDQGAFDTHTADWNWGDGSILPGSVDQANDTATGSYTYTTPGVYEVKVTVTDDNLDFGELGYQYIVIYDSSADGGFVTGAGVIDSPAGAYTQNSALSGIARFGFVSKYQPGANTPTGKTQFKFQTAQFTFRSTEYEWLVVAGSQVKFKGTGTVNDSGGNYGFQIFATDGIINGGGGVDKFRIKIWNKDNGDEVVYDNELDAGDDDNPTTVIQGGNIIIHD